ncbi:MAG: iron-sulfur cluster assembly accessory protein [Gammaproteobacteria bacterium]
MALVLTESAARHVETLRLGSRTSGCSRFACVVDCADAAGDDDVVFESHGVKVVVDKQSLQPIDGPEVDCLKSNALNQGFEFRNPDTRDTCGCGESFGV